jgi:hypothetical protein
MFDTARRKGDKGINQTNTGPRHRIGERTSTDLYGDVPPTAEHAARILRVMADWGTRIRTRRGRPTRISPRRSRHPCSRRRATSSLYKTEAFRDALGWCDSIRQRREIGVMVGRPGVGKTTTLREYANRTPGART